MAETSDTVTMTSRAMVCRLEGFAASPEALGALAAHYGAHAVMDTALDGAPPGPDPETLARLVGPDMARRITVTARAGEVVVRLGDTEAPNEAARGAGRRVRVVRAPRAEVEAVMSREAGGDTESDAGGPVQGALGAEDEAALQRDLRRIDAELGHPRGSREPGAPTTDGAAPRTARIFERADSRMSESVLRHRSSAHQHLRAAFAASRAAAAAGEAPAPGADDTPYRGDLAAMRDDDPAVPLRLEPWQRVGVARPRPSEADERDMGFREFCLDMRATTLADQLEAAAAWLADVERRDTFPRAALLDLLSEFGEESPALDDALRACARLLRAGRLQARSGGALAPTDTTRFRHAARWHDREKDR